MRGGGGVGAPVADDIDCDGINDQNPSSQHRE